MILDLQSLNTKNKIKIKIFYVLNKYLKNLFILILKNIYKIILKYNNIKCIIIHNKYNNTFKILNIHAKLIQKIN